MLKLLPHFDYLLTGLKIREEKGKWLYKISPKCTLKLIEEVLLNPNVYTLLVKQSLG